MRCIQVCKMSGARVLVVGRSEAKLRLAQELGADAVIQATQEDVTAAVRRLTDQEGVDIVFELVATRETMDHSLRSLRKRGRLVFIGYSEDQLIANSLTAGHRRNTDPRLGRQHAAGTRRCRGARQ